MINPEEPYRRALSFVREALSAGAGALTAAADLERVALLARQVADHRQLVPAEIDRFSAETQMVLTTFRMLREVLLLAKEAGLSRAGGRVVRCGSCRRSRPRRRCRRRRRRSRR